MNNLENSIKLLNENQLKAVQTLDGPVLVSAGAGSGKTRVLTLRIASLIANNYCAPSEILAITFTNKAANEMKLRVQKLVGYANMNISTFHSFCASFLRDNISRLSGYNSHFSIYADDEKNKVIKDIIKSNNIEEDIAKEVARHLSNAKNENMCFEDYINLKQHIDDSNLILNCMNAYQQRLTECNALDFDDLLTKTYEILQNNSDILEKYQQKFKYISIDEFQDTNKVQYDIAKILASKNHNILVVGDEDQCIYGWRGANINNISNFINDFNPVVIKLEQNYRSTKRIINCANKVIANNTQRLKKVLNTDNELGEDVAYKAYDNENLEADFVCRTILNMVNNGYNFNDFAVLMRLNALSRSFEERFLTYNIPYKLFGGFKFYDRSEIKGALAYFKLISNPNDFDALTRIVSFPKCGIGEATLNSFFDYTKNNNVSILNAILDIENQAVSTAVKNKFKALSEVLKKLIEMLNTSFYDAISELVYSSQIQNIFSEDSEENTNKLRNLDSLVNSIKDFEDNNGVENSLEKYLQSVTLSNDIDSYDEEFNSVTLSTIHAVKGLEFNTVFVVGLEENNFPLTRALYDFNEMEEERRLMYVAVTRAQKNLFLTRAKSRFMYGTRKYLSASTFVKEIGFENNFNYNYNTSNTDDDSGQYVSNAGVKDVKSMFISSINKSNTNAFVSNGEKRDYTKFVVGAKVTHTKYGNGTIIDNSELYSKKCVKIDFEDFGVKNLLVDYAPITLIEGD